MKKAILKAILFWFFALAIIALACSFYPKTSRIDENANQLKINLTKHNSDSLTTDSAVCFKRVMGIMNSPPFKKMNEDNYSIYFDMFNKQYCGEIKLTGKRGFGDYVNIEVCDSCKIKNIDFGE
jgi:hypothetical protein